MTLFFKQMAMALLIMLMGIPAAFSKDYDYININDPLLNKTPVAVTRFKVFNGHKEEVRDGARAEQILKDALDFTGYLKVMNPAAFLAEPAESGIQLGQINFRDWTGIGTELLVTGGIEESLGQVTLKLRLFDTYNTRLLVGRIYTGKRSQVRKMIHRFCSEIALKLTGNRGVFGSKIAFVSTVNGHKEIFVCDFDGHDPKRITRHNTISLSPDWSFDRNWLAYVSFAKGKADVYIKHIKENRGAIVNYEGMNIGPDWMPDSLKLAATLSFSGNQEIYLLTKKGEIIKRITRSWGSNVSPRFSPDGKQMAFTSSRSGNPQIYLKDLETNKVSRVTFNGQYNTSPAWSPDGRRLAYVGIEKNKINIFVINVNQGQGRPIPLTAGQGDNEDPSWSPDGNLIVFKSTREGGRAKLYVMTAAGTDQRRLLSMKGEQSQPDWSSSAKME
jgi:TolB protein